jgi:multidrug efflux system outer membrane protein
MRFLSPSALRLAPLAACSLLAACMVGPDYKRPDTGLPGAFNESSVATTQTGIPADWWKLYGDATLNGLVESGLQHNTDVLAAIARVEEAEAALREARATMFFPLVQGNAGASRSRSFVQGDRVTGSNYSLGLSTSFELDLWGRLRRAENVTRAQLAASQYGRDTVNLTVAATIARAYFALRSLDSQIAASESILAATDESLAIAQKRANAGIASELDVYQAGGAKTAASAQTKEFRRQRAVIAHQLGLLAGRVDLAFGPGKIEALPLPPLPPEGLPSSLLERRPDVRLAEAQLDAATQRIGVARGSQFPTLSLTASAGLQSPELSSLFQSGSSIWSLGANLLGPILDGGRYAARTEQAEAQAKQAEAAYVRTVQNAFKDVADALSSVRWGADAETDLVEHLDQTRAALRLAGLRYQQGYSAYLEVLDAQRSLNDAQLAFIRNRQAYLSYTVDLMNALGGGWQSASR